jgi:hypothetical protein
MAPSSQGSEPPRKPGRFRFALLIASVYASFVLFELPQLRLASQHVVYEGIESRGVVVAGNEP